MTERFQMKNILIVLYLVVSLLQVSCVKNEKKIRFGIITGSINHLPLSYAIERGLIDLSDYEFFHFNSGWELSEALLHKRVDLAILPFTYTWTAQSQGYDVKTISSFERETDAIIAKKRIQAISDLNNKKIGVLRASTLEALVLDLMHRHSVNVEIIPFRTPNEMMEALRNDNIDAASLYVPLLQKFTEEYHIVHWFSETYPEHTCCNLAGAGEFLKTYNPDILLSKLSEVLEIVADNPDDYIEFAMNIYGLNRDDVIVALQNTKFCLILTENDIDFEREMISKFKELEYLKEIPASEDVFYKTKE